MTATVIRQPPSSPDALGDRELAALGAAVYRHCGINLHPGKRQLVAARVAKRARAGGYRDGSHYLRDVLAAGERGAAFHDLVDALTTNLTSFFRERSHFDYLAERFLPDLLGRKGRDGVRRVRAWSAGCSTGEEPYSMAMTLLDVIDGAGPDAGGGCWDVKVLATDICRKVLDVARRGEYRGERLAELPPTTRQRHFTRGPAPRVTPRVREAVCFRYLNLIGAWPFTGGFDFIFCRNVMIYFDKPTQERLVDRMWERLPRGGLLFTGHAESLTGIRHRFRYVQPTVYLKP